VCGDCPRRIYLRLTIDCLLPRGQRSRVSRDVISNLFLLLHMVNIGRLGLKPCRISSFWSPRLGSTVALPSPVLSHCLRLHLQYLIYSHRRESMPSIASTGFGICVRPLQLEAPCTQHLKLSKVVTATSLPQFQRRCHYTYLLETGQQLSMPRR
jgi:hypothetical protein